jgi:hypothetical protein
MTDCVIQGTVASGTITPQGLQVGGLYTEVTLNATTWTALPATPLEGRNQLNIQNTSGVDIKVNFDTFAALPVGYVGILIADGSERQYAIKDSILIYAKAASGTPTIGVEELA